MTFSYKSGFERVPPSPSGALQSQHEQPGVAGVRRAGGSGEAALSEVPDGPRRREDDSPEAAALHGAAGGEFTVRPGEAAGSSGGAFTVPSYLRVPPNKSLKAARAAAVY